MAEFLRQPLFDADRFRTEQRPARITAVNWSSDSLNRGYDYQLEVRIAEDGGSQRVAQFGIDRARQLLQLYGFEHPRQLEGTQVLSYYLMREFIGFATR